MMSLQSRRNSLQQWQGFLSVKSVLQLYNVMLMESLVQNVCMKLYVSCSYGKFDNATLDVS